MELRRKFASFMRMSAADRMMVVEAILLLGIARLIVLTVPFRLMVQLLSHTPDKGAAGPALLERIGWAITVAARNVPWNAVCLPQAIAAKAMLARRGWGASFHLGVGFNNQGKLIAHAWLLAGDTVVVGAAGIPDVTPLQLFG
jgi:Transglutaminase-like superfamily